MAGQESRSKVTQGKVSRRRFLAGSLAAATFSVVPRHVLGGSGEKPPSEKLNIAGVGVGGMGHGNVNNCSGENIVALCDVDENYASRTFKKYPKAKVWKDFRRMLDKQKEIEAVVVATPDHTHAIVSLAAMELGKGVYTQKPLTHSVWEARKLREAAQKYDVATQMGNQGHAGDSVRQLKEWIQAGAIGKVREVHCWTDRPFGWWPQGVGRPKGTPSVPSNLDWNLWLGPAPKRPYHPAYHPFAWRGWWDFGTGSLGDMGCHVMDGPFFALELGYPTSVEATVTGFKGGAHDMIKLDGHEFPVQSSCVGPDAETAPAASVIRYDFPERGDMPPVSLTWWDGGLKPERPPELESSHLPSNGNLFIGDKGKILCGTYGSNLRMVPRSKMDDFDAPPATLDRIKVSHEEDWIRACKGGKPASSNFNYSGPLTEVVLLGNLALRTGRRLEWNGEKMKVTNVPDANKYVRDDYRKDWSM